MRVVTYVPAPAFTIEVSADELLIIERGLREDVTGLCSGTASNFRVWTDIERVAMEGKLKLLPDRDAARGE